MWLIPAQIQHLQLHVGKWLKNLKPTYDEKQGVFIFCFQRNDISPVFSIENYLPAIEVGDWRNS